MTYAFVRTGLRFALALSIFFAPPAFAVAEVVACPTWDTIHLDPDALRTS